MQLIANQDHWNLFQQTLCERQEYPVHTKTEGQFRVSEPTVCACFWTLESTEKTHTDRGVELREPQWWQATALITAPLLHSDLVLDKEGGKTLNVQCPSYSCRSVRIMNVFTNKLHLNRNGCFI